MTAPLLIVGCGGFGRQVNDVVDAINAGAASRGEPAPWSLIGYLDDGPSEADRRRLAVRSRPLLGGVAGAADHAGAWYAIGIMAGDVRERIAGALEGAGLRPALLVHPTVTVGFGVDLGPGSVLCDGVRLMNEVRVGRHVHINLNATIGHDCVLEDFCTVNPLVAVSGNCHISRRAMLGTHSTILPQRRVGTGAVVGAGACVVRDVDDGSTVKGVPAR